jgi:hypothetical protein
MGLFDSLHVNPPFYSISHLPLRHHQPHRMGLRPVHGPAVQHHERTPSVEKNWLDDAHWLHAAAVGAAVTAGLFYGLKMKGKLPIAAGVGVGGLTYLKMTAN